MVAHRQTRWWSGLAQQVRSITRMQYRASWSPVTAPSRDQGFSSWSRSAWALLLLALLGSILSVAMYSLPATSSANLFNQAQFIGPDTGSNGQSAGSAAFVLLLICLLLPWMLMESCDMIRQLLIVQRSLARAVQLRVRGGAKLLDFASSGWQSALLFTLIHLTYLAIYASAAALLLTLVTFFALDPALSQPIDSVVPVEPAATRFGWVLLVLFLHILTGLAQVTFVVLLCGNIIGYVRTPVVATEVFYS